MVSPSTAPWTEHAITKIGSFYKPSESLAARCAEKPCGRLSWLPVSFLLHVNYPLSYRIVKGETITSRVICHNATNWP